MLPREVIELMVLSVGESYSRTDVRETLRSQGLVDGNFLDGYKLNDTGRALATAIVKAAKEMRGSEVAKEMRGSEVGNG